MSEFKGTKGEWTSKHREAAGFEVYNKDNNIICSMGWYQFPSEIMNIEIEQANSDLIADAGNVRQQINCSLPELLSLIRESNDKLSKYMKAATNEKQARYFAGLKVRLEQAIKNTTT